VVRLAVRRRQTGRMSVQSMTSRATWLALEPSRAAGELGLLVGWSPLLARTPRGDGHTVLVMPGLGASDLSTRPLRRFLKGLGYDVHGWGLGRNEGPTARMLDGVGSRFLDLHGRRGDGVSLVGWSMGGIFARRLARLNPDAVRQVITLGSPFRMLSDTGSASLRVPSTSVFSKTDGIAPWRSCFDGFGARHEAVEVIGSHCGLGHHPAVLHLVAERLAQSPHEWKPFVARGVWKAWFPAVEHD
jgi:pimeloyl-ACP methyl ester carboxylesterase